MENIFLPKTTDIFQEEAKKIISHSREIALLPSQTPVPICCALTLFYSLKELKKNVNLIIEELPQDLKFLTPSLDFISFPKNLTISIPRRIAEVSQIYYEKDNDFLKIFLTLEGKPLKKEDISFYFAQEKPDLVITLGIKDYFQELKERLNPFGYLLDSPVLNIDTVYNFEIEGMENKKFGKINLIEEKGLVQTVYTLINEIDNRLLKKEAAEALLVGLLYETQYFKKNLSPEVFEIASQLIKLGANIETIKNHLKF